jgi:two-component system CheB/CheR fusion protein
VVDDWADAADSTVELLTLWGYDARACYDGATALESARAQRPDAVLLDLVMPRMDGFRFAQLFREPPGRTSIPIIAISGYTGAAHYARAREVGIQHYLLKPANPERLRELLAWEVVPSVVPASVGKRLLRPVVRESVPA